ncbi:MAG: class I SAM-dependent methyltransferase [Kiritimatiellae bacterium]|nr:class I SAM-dependent methyltransferase [Kiritimatiellia bacterium]
MYELDSRLRRDDEVLDIGSNAGFLSLMIAKRCARVDAVELNPYLVRIAQRCREFDGADNVSFLCSSFEDADLSGPYSLVLSLANHHTFDGNMRPDFRRYIERIRSLTASGGRLLFESHPGEYRRPELRQHLDEVRDLFQVNGERVTSSYRSVYDTNRLVVWLDAV